MCTTCGCEGEAHPTLTDLQTGRVSAVGAASAAVHEHVAPDGTRYRHAHGDGGPDHGHLRPPLLPAPPHAPAGAVIDLQARVLAKNDALAARTRSALAQRQILLVNLMSAPGAGKTTLLERSIRDVRGRRPLLVVEGDQATANDGERIRAAGAAAVQVNTGTGCHLDAEMVAGGLAALAPPRGALVVVENVGNLVCPALFDVGEHRRVVVLSVTEGEDKPLKYPHMFRSADLVLLNKIDLLPHLDFDLAQAIDNARAANPAVAVLCVSARTGAGLQAWYDWLEASQPGDRAGEQRPPASAAAAPASLR